MTSLTRGEVVSRIEATGVVAVLRLTDASVGRDVAQALVEGGVTALEVTMTVPRAAALIQELSGVLPETCLVGAGTVVDADDQAIGCDVTHAVRCNKQVIPLER